MYKNFMYMLTSLKRDMNRTEVIFVYRPFNTLTTIVAIMDSLCVGSKECHPRSKSLG